MANVASSAFLVLSCLLLLGCVFSDDSSSSDEESEQLQLWSSGTNFQYKVKALNTALYYILQALEDDLKDGVEVDIGYFIRINILANKIKLFNGEVDETNSLMLGQVLRTLPDYLRRKVDLLEMDLGEFTAATLAEASVTPLTT